VYQKLSKSFVFDLSYVRNQCVEFFETHCIELMASATDIMLHRHDTASGGLPIIMTRQ